MMFSKLSVAALSLGRMSWPVQAEDKPSIGLYELMTLGEPLEPIVEVTEFEPLTGRVFIEAHPDMKGSVAASVYIPKDETSPCADGQFYGSSGEEGSDEIAFDADADIPDEVEGKTKNGSLGAITFEINDPMESPFYSGNDDEGVVNMCISAEINGGDDLGNQLISYVDTHLTVQVIHGSIFASYGQNVQLSSLEPGSAEERIDNTVPVETEIVTKKEFEEKESYRVGMDFSIYAYLEQEQKDKGWSIVGFDEILCGGEVLKASGEDPGILTEISTDSSLLHDAPDDEGAYFTSVVLPAFEPTEDGSSEFLCEGKVKLKNNNRPPATCAKYNDDTREHFGNTEISIEAYFMDFEWIASECYAHCESMYRFNVAPDPSSHLILVNQCHTGDQRCVCSSIPDDTAPIDAETIDGCAVPQRENGEEVFSCLGSERTEEDFYVLRGSDVLERPRRPAVTCFDPVKWPFYENDAPFMIEIGEKSYEELAEECLLECAKTRQSSLVLVSGLPMPGCPKPDEDKFECMCSEINDELTPHYNERLGAETCFAEGNGCGSDLAIRSDAKFPLRPRVTCVDWHNNLEYFGNYYVNLDHLDSMDFETVASACFNVCLVHGFAYPDVGSDDTVFGVGLAPYPRPAFQSLILVNQNAIHDGSQQCVCTSVPDDTPPMEPEEIENCSLPEEIGPVIDDMEDYFVLRGSDLVDYFDRSDVTCFDRGDKKLMTSYYDYRFNGQFLEEQEQEVLVEKGDKTTKELTIECLEKCRNNDKLPTPFSSGLVFLEHYLPECAPPEDDQIRCVCSGLPNWFPSFREETQTFAQCVEKPHGCGSTFIIKSDAAFLQDQPTEGDDTGGDTQPEEKQQEVKGVGRRLQDTGAGAAVLPETTAFSATVTVSRTEGDGLGGLWAPAEGIAGRASTVAATAAVAAAFALAATSNRLLSPPEQHRQGNANGIGKDNPAQHHTTPHHATPRNTTQHHATPHHATPRHPSPNQPGTAPSPPMILRRIRPPPRTRQWGIPPPCQGERRRRSSGSLRAPASEPRPCPFPWPCPWPCPRRGGLPAGGNPGAVRWWSSPAPRAPERATDSEAATTTTAAPIDSESTNTNGNTNTHTDAGEKSIEERYSRKTPLEHVLLRPGMYVGPTERLPPADCWAMDPLPPPVVLPPPGKDGPIARGGDPLLRPPLAPSLVRREAGLVPALQKIFDEILVNATDNHLRHPKTCNKLEVSIDRGDPSEGRPASVWISNNGTGIPLEVHTTEGIYVPELLFGHLLTGSNFDDGEKRLTGGRHGYGAKLANIFSDSFVFDAVDAEKGKKYTQAWSGNMSVAGPPELEELGEKAASGTTPAPASESYTCVSFCPDLPRLTGDPAAATIDDKDYSVMCRRVLDAAGCAAGGLSVYLNGTDVSMASFGEYARLYRGEGAAPVRFCTPGPRWEVGVGLSETGSFEAVSFVNGMATPRGGTHVQAIAHQVAKRVHEKACRADPGLSGVLTPGMAKKSLFLACNAYIENPSFDSQMKECLTSGPQTFGSSCALPERFLRDLVKPLEKGGPGIVEEVLRAARGKQQASLFKQVGGKKTKRQLLSIPKLEDAHEAASGASSCCTLILTEGDSAKALAVAGLENIGRDRFGVFPLRGKFLNVRHATVDQLSRNAEVKALVAILGLDFDKEYRTREERESLRYGRVMLMTDQDTDGSHIKGLVMNFFRHFWPGLLQPATSGESTPGVEQEEDQDQEQDQQPFLSSFLTPLLKATRKGRKAETLSFYSMAEYNAWRKGLLENQDASESIGNWKVKYYKGLGTSTPTEAKEYFADFDKHHVRFRWNSNRDGELLDKVFDKARAADRRDWIETVYDPDATVSYDATRTGNSLTYEDFVNKEMIHFSNSDNVRSIPSVVDGLKPSQRKVLHACFKRKLKSEIKVAQLSGYCAEHTAYHHGEASLQGTIIGMAQDFVGSNNLNLLTPSGQFGTRLAGGEDAASPRYIFTRLSPVSRYLFPEEDDILLDYLEEDGQRIEPRFFCPIIPLLLVNGSQGIGTGWSTFIPQHDPISVLDYVRAKLDESLHLPQIEPYTKGFQGRIERTENGYKSYGSIKALNKRTVVIDELPIGVWTNSYKALLLRMQTKGAIVDFKENHTTTKVSFTIRLKPSQMIRMEQTGLEHAFKLTSNLLLTNMNAFNADGLIQKFDSPESIADAYFPTRLSLYDDRKSVLTSEMNYKSEVLKNKARFIQLVSDGKIHLVGGQMTEEKTVSELTSFGFRTVEELNSLRNNNSIHDKLAGCDVGPSENDEVVEENYNGKSSFDYLFKMPLSSLTSDRISALMKEAAETESNLNDIRGLRSEELWLSDLDKLASRL
ncbi:unnamed protein product [Pseudo-nitzschia multistriata]|uniref:DNA topoisomerase (ATP-hydrolyzing) n=1 Tax=Pseudo-nitzschia multistriata TaxID=183589 RepID=A0A448Z0S1_9STRA|nr:unnamed protein product [Pseudo-nitzschia multistriata]